MNPMTPASPAETADTRDTDRFEAILKRFNLADPIDDDDHEWLIEEVARLRKSRHVHCGCNIVHKPGQQLADLLRTATEFDEIADTVLAHADLTTRDAITALRAAVRALQGPPAPFRPQQAHAAPATCPCCDHDRPECQFCRCCCPHGEKPAPATTEEAR